MAGSKTGVERRRCEEVREGTVAVSGRSRGRREEDKNDGIVEPRISLLFCTKVLYLFLIYTIDFVFLLGKSIQTLLSQKNPHLFAYLCSLSWEFVFPLILILHNVPFSFLYLKQCPWAPWSFVTKRSSVFYVFTSCKLESLLTHANCTQ